MEEILKGGNKIKRVSIDNADKFVLENKLWGYDSYNTEVYAQIAYDESGFLVKFTVREANPLCEKRHHFEEVCEDSCVEFFVNFTPRQSDKYINFEVNAVGITNIAFRSSRYDGVPISLEEIEALKVKPEISKEQWTVTYKIGYDFIRNYFPEFDMDHCDYILGNLYKCGNKTKNKHYLSYFKVDTEKPDYHRPEYFGKFVIEKEGRNLWN